MDIPTDIYGPDAFRREVADAIIKLHK